MSSPKSLPKSPSLNLKQPPRILSSPQSQSSSPQSNGGNSGAEGNSEGGTDSSGRGGPGSNQSGQDPPGNAGNGGRGGRDGGGGGGGNKHDDDDKERGTDDDREQSMEKLNEDSNWQYTRKTGPQPDPAHFHIVPSSTKQSFNSRRRENAQTCRVECDRIPISLAPAPQSCEGTENHNQMLTDQHIPTQGRCEITTCLPTEKLREAQGGLAGQEHIKTGSPEAESDQVQESYIVSQDAGDQSYQSSVYDGELLPQSVDSNSNSEIVIISPKVSLPTCSGKSHFVYVKPPLVSSETDPSLSHYLQWTIDTVGYVKWFWSNESGDVDSPCFEEGYNSTPQEEDGSVYGTSIQILESSEDNNQCLYSELVAGRILVPHEYTAIPLFSLPTVSRADADSSSSEDSVYFDANQSPDPPSVNRTESSASYASVQSSSHELEIDYHGWEEAEELVKDTPSQGNGAGHEIPAERPDDEQATQCADTGETNPLITSHTQFVIKPVICLLTASDIASEEESESLAPEFATFSSNAAPSSLQPDTSDCFTISPIQESPVVPRVYQELRQSGIQPVQVCHGGFPLELFIQRAVQCGHYTSVAEVLLHLVHCFRICIAWNTPFMLHSDEVYVNVKTHELMINAVRCIQLPLQCGVPRAVCVQTFEGRLGMMILSLLQTIVDCETVSNWSDDVKITAILLRRLVDILNNVPDCYDVIDELSTIFVRYKEGYSRLC